MRYVSTVLGAFLGAIIIFLGGVYALFAPRQAVMLVARGVFAVYRQVIATGFRVSGLDRCQPRFGGQQLVIATHPPTLITLMLAAWMALQVRGRIVIVLREGLPLAGWFMRVTGVGVSIPRGQTNLEVLQREVSRRLALFEGQPWIVLYFPDRSRPKEQRLVDDHAYYAQSHPEEYEAGAFPAPVRTFVPRLAGLQAILAALPEGSMVTMATVGHEYPSPEVPWFEAWRPLRIHLEPADHLLGSGETLRKKLYALWGLANRRLSDWGRCV